MNTLRENIKQTHKMVRKLGKAVNNLNNLSFAMFKMYRYDLPAFDLDDLIKDAAILFREQYKLQFGYIHDQLLDDYGTFQEVRHYLLELRILSQERQFIEQENEFKN